MTTLTIAFDPEPSAATRDAIERGVNLHNVAATGQSDWYPVAFTLKDEHGEVRGGLLGEVWAGWMHVSFLSVDRPLRRQGWAAKLLAAAEDYARARGAHDVHLETFSFQARPFYEKQGYEVFATLDGFPPGHAKFFLRKRLTAGC
ncbi:MAG: GNAT family N-acetyltransferase [Deltaproteobacteria bacterium]|nr:GNAT family N-acetyltransferase [Deltaproteobacteria bacterium]